MTSSENKSAKTPATDYSLLAPGPVNLHPEVEKIMGLPMIHHRTPEFDKILGRVLSGLRHVFQTQNQVFIHTSTGTGGMESLIVNTLSHGDEVLVIDSGKFGERFAEIAKAFQLKAHVLKIPWGKACNPNDVKSFLEKNPQTKAVLTQATETSTATIHPIQKLGQIIAKFENTLFLVDGITAVGALPLPMDEWHIDGLVAGSQKAFMLPTGMSFISFSKKAWTKIHTANLPRFYFDIRLEKKANDKGETLFSSPVSLIRALDWVLEHIQTKGLQKHQEEVHRFAEMTRAFALACRLDLYSESPSDSVTAIKTPETIDSQKLRQLIEEKYNITIMGGQDQLKGKIIRIGHMGYIQDQSMIRLFGCLTKSMHELDSSLYSEEEQIHIQKQMHRWLQDHP